MNKNHELNVRLHMELQQSEQLRQHILQEFHSIESVMDHYRDYKLRAEAGLLARGGQDASPSFSQHVLARERGEKEEAVAVARSEGAGNGDSSSRSSAVTGANRAPVVTPALISTTALLAKLAQHDLHA